MDYLLLLKYQEHQFVSSEDLYHLAFYDGHQLLFDLIYFQFLKHHLLLQPMITNRHRLLPSLLPIDQMGTYLRQGDLKDRPLRYNVNFLAGEQNFGYQIADGFHHQ